MYKFRFGLFFLNFYKTLIYWKLKVIQMLVCCIGLCHGAKWFEMWLYIIRFCDISKQGIYIQSNIFFAHVSLLLLGYKKSFGERYNKKHLNLQILFLFNYSVEIYFWLLLVVRASFWDLSERLSSLSSAVGWLIKHFFSFSLFTLLEVWWTEYWALGLLLCK